MSRVNQLQRQLIVHSYLYYTLHAPIWTDDKWQEAANELVGMDMKDSEFEDAFKDWNGSTGYHLCAIVKESPRLLGLCDWLGRYHYEHKYTTNRGTGILSETDRS